MPSQPDNRRLEHALQRLAARQHGVGARWQLIKTGFTASAIDDRVAAGRLRLVHRGVYALGHQPLTRQGRWLAAVLACGPEAVLSHSGAARLWGLIPDGDGAVDVTVPSKSGRRSRPGICLHRCDLQRSDTTVREGIPVTIVARTLLDLTPSLPRRELERALDESIYLRRATVGTLRAALERNARRPGAAALRAALARHEPGTSRTETELEELMFRLCRKHNLPQPVCQEKILGYRVDFYWPKQRLIVETDGWDGHRSRVKFEEDRERDIELRAAGYPPPLRFTHRHLTSKPEWVAERLRAELTE